MTTTRKVTKKSTIVKAINELKKQMEELETVIHDYEILDDNDPVFSEHGVDAADVHCGGGSKD